MKTILVPTDFSPNAEKALHFAVQIAKLAKAEVVLLHVCSDLIEPAFKNLQTLYEEYNQPTVVKAWKQLTSLKQTIESSEKFDIKVRLYKGSVTDSILQATVDCHSDLIIMGTQGEAALLSNMFGSQTAEIITKTDVPVMAVPQLGEWVLPKNILLAVNDFTKPPGIINPVFELAVLFNTHIHAVTFTDEDSAEAVDYLNHKRGLSVYEEKLRMHYNYTGITAVHLSGNRFEGAIEKYIFEKDIDIMSMISHKRSLLESIFNPSLTKKMSYHTRIPLLVIPA